MTAKPIKNEVSDCIVAPDYSPEALEILKKKKGNYNIFKIKAFEMDNYKNESKYINGINIEQHSII